MQRGLFDVEVITVPISRVGSDISGGQVIGISLGSDAVSEHEWGIKGILEAFGVPRKPSQGVVGADVRTVTKIPSDKFKFFPDLKGYAYLMFMDQLAWGRDDCLTPEYFDRVLGIYHHPGKVLATAWDSYSFGIRLKNDILNPGSIVLGQVHEAFTKLDAMIFLSGQVAFAGRGLRIAIRSRVPEDALENMREVDQKYLDLLEEDKNIGIGEKLKASGRDFFALAPAWASERENINTKYPIIYYLNPRNQGIYNSGWFSVEELLDWIEDRGPVCKLLSS